MNLSLGFRDVALCILFFEETLSRVLTEVISQLN